MQRYGINQFDSDTFVVIDNYENREVCVCGNYQEWTDAEKRARQIANVLNKEAHQMPKTRQTPRPRDRSMN